VFKTRLADLLSVIAMVGAEGDELECLTFCIAGTKQGLEEWGQEYLRSLAGDVAKETQKRFKEAGEEAVDFSDMMFLVDIIVPYCMSHNSESEAVDFLMEMDKINVLVEHTNSHNYERVCGYLLACAPYSADYEDS
jgi:26S proteasome regulatory subunit N1